MTSITRLLLAVFILVVSFAGGVFVGAVSTGFIHVIHP